MGRCVYVLGPWTGQQATEMFGKVGETEQDGI